MKRQLIFFSLSLFLFSCQTRQKFNKIRWAQVADLMTFPNRKYMVDDLITNYHLRGKKYNEIIQLLGQPQGGIDSNLQMFYDIEVHYGSHIDPVYSKTLSFQFDRDSLVTNCEVKEWKK